MNEKMLKTAAELLKMPLEEVEKYSKPLPELGAAYFWKPTRGGGAVIITPEGEKLGAGSSVSFERHVQAFRAGKRN